MPIADTELQIKRLFGAGGFYLFNGQSELKDRFAGKARGTPQTPTMRFNDRPANRQAHSHALELSCEECTEDFIDIFRVDPAAES